jgi:hypothetical protein
MHISHITCLERPPGQLRPTGFDIIMPVCKRVDNALRALWSIAAQENAADIPVHLIIVDDGGNDNLDNVRMFLDIAPVPKWLDVSIVSTGATLDNILNSSRAYNKGFEYLKYNYVIKSGADMLWGSSRHLEMIAALCDINRYVFSNLCRITQQRAALLQLHEVFAVQKDAWHIDHNQNYYP